METKRLYYSKKLGHGGSRIPDNKAQIYGESLAEIINENGGVANTQLIVDKATDSSSPLHDWFEWDDTIAANKHRKYQARHLLKNIEVEVIINNKSTEIVRAFHYVEKEDGDEIKHGFARFEIIQQNKDDYNEFIVKAYLKRVRELNAQYEKYKELQSIIEAINKILDKESEK